MEALGKGQALTVAFALDKESYDKLEKVVKKIGVTKSRFLRDLIIHTIELYEKKQVEDKNG